MSKKVKPLLIGTLALGLFLGSSSLINPSMASAATTGNQLITGSQLSANVQQSAPALNNQSTAVPKTGAQQPAAQSGNNQVKQGLSRQYDQKMCQSFDRIIARAANLMGVSKEVVLEGLKDGNTLVEIAADNDVTNKTTLARLRLLQKELNQCINVNLPSANQRSTFFNHMEQTNFQCF